MKNSVLSLTALTDLAVISLTGADATSFLQSQITQDVNALGPNQAALAGYCTAKGRLLASMITLQKGSDPADGWLLLTKADAALAFGQRLRMFVLRAKVDVTVSEMGVVGVRVGDPDNNQTATSPALAQDQSTSGSLTLPDAAVPYSVIRRGADVWISAPQRDNAPYARWWLLATEGGSPQVSDTGLQAWQADDIAAGLPWVQAATQEAFIPQTINMDLINGISFTKGCYPGQEVVARSHYRGTVKRRTAYATGAAISAESVNDLIGKDTFDATNPGRPCGRVINAAVADDTLHVLMEVQLTDLDSADFRLEADDGLAVTVVALPYSIQPVTPS